MKRRIVITGMGLVSPLGCDLEVVWKRLCAAESAMKFISQFDSTGQRTTFCGNIADDFHPEEFIELRDLKKIDRSGQFGVVAGGKAIRHSQLDFSQEDTTRCGVIMGTGIGGLITIEEQHSRLLERGPQKVSPFTIPRLIANSISAYISIFHGLKGTTYAVSSACASATAAMGAAIDDIRLNRDDIVITGGAEAAITDVAFASFGAMRAMSEKNDDPQHASRPFDKDRDGFVMSEGAGVLVFEELEHAKRRGAVIYAEVLGYGTSSDAYHIAQPEASGKGAARAMRNALMDAQITPDRVDYINAHGTSTPLGDAAETSAIKQVFGDDAYKLCVSSTKGQTGHLLGASGGVEGIFSVLAIRDQLIPPTANLYEPSPECDLDYVPLTARPRDVNIVMSNNFGFGGHNSSILFGKYTDNN